MHRSTLRTLAVITPFLLLTACAGSVPTTEVTAGRLTGTWVGPDGERVTLGADRTVATAGLGTEKLAATDCVDRPSKGSWSFLAAKGGGALESDESARSGSWIALSFAFHGPAENCHLELSVVDGGKGLCASDDLDFPCALDVKFTRRS
ncbi:hypothetical protein [Streptomyces sp. NPDC007088]|uniref:hypothetical protein n=1 Tax=Streptomyces sp. NPDC007088 TaxID=3364773 RepID=UPI0036BE72F9